jgi:6-pyruvoyltetrahydropterin/6-carboxytetrahydropterin synthase
MTTSVTVSHNFETGHRLPHLGGKCQSLHGHSWWAYITITSAKDPRYGTVVEFGAAKRVLRAWIDEHLDHGVMLGAADPLIAPLAADGRCKVFVFGKEPTSGRFGSEPVDDPARFARTLPWPTVENVAELIGRVGWHLVQPLVDHDEFTVSCRVTETHVNAAEWRP